MPKNNQLKTNLTTALNKFLQNTNYIGGIMQNGITQMSNPKWLDFDETGIRRREAIVNNSVSQGLLHPDLSSVPASAIGGRYNPFANVIYASLDASKANRIYEYRLMASYPEVTDAIEEISNSFITFDETTHLPAWFKYNDKKAPLECLNTLKEEWEYFVNMFNFKQNGKKYCTDFIVDGEVYLELVICNDSPETRKKGILGVQRLQTELMETIYKDKSNGLVASYVGRSVAYDPNNPQNIVKMSYVPYHPNEVFYVSSGNWDPSGEYVVPFIERARKRYIQLSYLEDAIIIYRLVRAPERLIFTVDTSNMPAPAAEQHLRNLQQAYWKTKTFDINVNDITQKYEPQAMLDAFWIAKQANGNSVEITQLAGGQNLGQLDDLNYFIKALYRALHVPVSRLDPDKQAAVDPSQTLQEEIKFAEFIISIQRQFAEALKQAFITHLKFKGLYQKYKLRENLMDIEFYPPQNYFKMRGLQRIQIEADAFGKLAGIDTISKTYLMKRIFGWGPEEILESYKMRKLEAAEEWEIQQILNGGPNWKEMVLAQMSAGGGAEGGGDMDMAGGDMDMGGMDMGGMDMGGGDMDMGGGDMDMGGMDAGDTMEATGEELQP